MVWNCRIEERVVVTTVVSRRGPQSLKCVMIFLSLKPNSYSLHILGTCNYIVNATCNVVIIMNSPIDSVCSNVDRLSAVRKSQLSATLVVLCTNGI